MSEIGDKILAAIREKPMQFYEIDARIGIEGDVHFRVIDRELQRLRRAGLIKYNRVKRVWRAATPTGDTQP